MLSYDQTRTVQTHIELGTAAGRRISHLTRTHARSVRGVQGYFWACLEGGNLRVFVDDLVEPQVW